MSTPRDASLSPRRDVASPLPSAAADGDLRGSRAVPEATVARLAVYLRVLSALGERGITTVSSGELADAAGVNPAKLRKDLSYLGSYGVRGVGYDVATLHRPDRRALGVDRAPAGRDRRRRQPRPRAGRLRRVRARAGSGSSALVDADPARVGTSDRRPAGPPRSTSWPQVVAERRRSPSASSRPRPRPPRRSATGSSRPA